MSDAFLGATFWTVDFAPLMAALLASLACALVGNFLILTRQAMSADALSHAIVPGVVAGAALFGATSSLALAVGGLVAALAAQGAIAFLIRVARVEAGAALGVVFTSFFACGVILMETSGLSRTAFDIHHLVLGALETLIWLPPAGATGLSFVLSLPPALFELAIALALVAAIVLALKKELALVAFDPVFAEASGLPVKRLEVALGFATALACLAAFRSVGVILAVAMIVGPPATARLLTNRLDRQIALSLLIAAGVTIGGYALAAHAPALVGSTIALNAAGVIGALAAVTLGVVAAVVEASNRRARA